MQSSQCRLEVFADSWLSILIMPDIHVLQRDLADVSMCSVGLATSQRKQ